MKDEIRCPITRLCRCANARVRFRGRRVSQMRAAMTLDIAIISAEVEHWQTPIGVHASTSSRACAPFVTWT